MKSARGSNRKTNGRRARRVPKRTVASVTWAWLIFATLLAGCSSQQEVIVDATQGRRASVAEINRDPWALLPGGAVAWVWIDAQALFDAPYGGEAAHLLSEHLPLARDSGFEPEQHIDEVMLGAYATVGSDVAAVARGRFDAQALADRIAEAPEATHGRRIVVHEFAGFQVYVLGPVAMVPVTDQTLVFGTEIGVRRVLERIEEGRLGRSLPAWYESMLKQEGAELVLGVDLDAQPVPAAVRSEVAFLQGLRAGRLLGNFQQPGLNLAGTLSYDRPDSATAAVESILEQKRSLDRASVLLRVLRVPRPIHRLEARATNKEAQVALEVDARAIGALLARSEQVADSLDAGLDEGEQP